MSVIVIKMISGEEVLATLEKASGDIITVSRARVLQVSNDGKAGLFPYIIISPDATFNMSESAIVAWFEAPAEVEKSYLSAVSGIALAGQ